MNRVGTCRCGSARAECQGEPVRISICHCLACKQRTGSAFSAQARWRVEDVRITGETTTYTRVADSGTKITYRFCPHCGSTIAYTAEDNPALVAVPMGAFADPNFPAPTISVYEHRKHPWVQILGDVRHEADTD